jgi:hypothetical protein
VRREHTGRLVVAERLVVPGGGEMPRPPVAQRERRVRDLADERLGEAELAALGRSRVGVELEDLPVDERPQARLERLAGQARDGREGRDAERLAQHRPVLQEASVGGIDGIEPGGDEGMERVGDLERAKVAHHAIDAVRFFELAVLDQHPDRLDGMSGMPSARCRMVRTVLAAAGQGLRGLAHRVVGERLEGEGHELRRPAPYARRRSRRSASQGDHEDRVADRPLEQMVDEVEQAGVGPLEVLEHEDGRALRGDALEEPTPGCDSSSRPPAGASPAPSSARRAGSMRRRSSSSGTNSATVAPIRSTVVASSSASARPARRRTISPSAQNVTPSPNDGERPWCQKMSSLTPSMCRGTPRQAGSCRCLPGR